ncbi:hypothetical protein GCM10023175_51480 [Pseudonocardia xishanensis]|uniref:CsbD-like domain-containing protein n=2 Tax=Pseudonocardia xishanensis TaxID=630995 RepID=A0ABP8RY48_9PSEU
MASSSPRSGGAAGGGGAPAGCRPSVRIACTTLLRDPVPEVWGGTFRGTPDPSPTVVVANPARPSDTASQEVVMGMKDKMENKAQELAGKGKEATGRATDDEQLEAEGRTDQMGADVKQAGEKVKDVFKR